MAAPRTTIFLDLENFRLTSTSRLTLQTTPKVRFTSPNPTIYQHPPALRHRDHPAIAPPALHSVQQRTGTRDTSDRHGSIRFLRVSTKCRRGWWCSQWKSRGRCCGAEMSHCKLDTERRLTDTEQQSSVTSKHGVSTLAPSIPTHHG